MTQHQQNKQQQNKTARQENRATSAATGNDFEAQTRYWREQFKNEPYYNAGQRFESYEPAYSLGMQGRTQYADKGFDQVEEQLRAQYEANARQQGMLQWSEARQAVRAAWEHADECMTGTDKSDARQPRPRH